MDRSAVILAGGISARAVLELEGKPLLCYVIDSVGDLVDEIVVVVESQECADAYSKNVAPDVRFVVDQRDGSPVSQALAGFEAAKGEYTLVLPAGTPFVSLELLSLLFDLSVGKSAVVPRWTNQECEPQHAVYCTEKAIEASRVTLSEGSSDLESMVDKLRGVRYISTMVIEQIDPDFKSFVTVTTPADMRKATSMDKSKPPTKKRKGSYRSGRV